MKKKDPIKIFENLGAILTGHFVLRSGLHAGHYLHKDRVYPHTIELRLLCDRLARKFSGLPNGSEVEVVVGLAMGGIILSWVVADCLTTLAGRQILGVFAEKRNSGGFEFTSQRGFRTLVIGKRVLIVEDIITQGSAVLEGLDLIRVVGGIPIGVGVLWNRGGVTAKRLGVPLLYSLIKKRIEAWSPEECRQKHLCHDRVPINTDLGHGKNNPVKQ